MSKIDVNKIVDSILVETKSTRVDLLEQVRDRIEASVDEFQAKSEEEQDNTPPYVPFIAEVFTFVIDREMEIYKNIEYALQRVIDEMDTVKR